MVMIDNQISKVAGSVQKYYEVNSVFLSIVDWLYRIKEKYVPNYVIIIILVTQHRNNASVSTLTQVKRSNKNSQRTTEALIKV